MEPETTTIKLQAHEVRQIEISKPGDYVIELNGTGAQAKIRGAFLTQGKERVAVNLLIIHRAPHTAAQTTLRGVAKDQSHVRFFGRIKIEPNCPGAQSFLEERILLLSETATAEAVPELEILSNDVKCSHAASISPIPEAQLFYLQSRGLTRQVAEMAISEGFLELVSPSR